MLKRITICTVASAVIAIASIIAPVPFVSAQERPLATVTFIPHPSTQEPNRLVTLDTLKK